MKAKTLQIVWHGKEPVFTLDFHPTNPALLATGGADKDIKLWEVHREQDGAPAVNYVSSVGGLTSAVNIIRFSPTGETMVSGGNTGEMVLWRSVDPGQKAAVLGADGPAPTWKTCGALRGHADDVHDLAWSPDGSALVSGGVENICILWDVDAKRGMLRLENHQHYVQGVAWDPLGHYICSQSNDRTCKVYGQKPPAAGKKGLQAPISSAAALREFVVAANISKRVCTDVDTNNAAGTGTAQPITTKYPMFMDENVSTFFRRLSWSPDGAFLVVPTGLHKTDGSSNTVTPTTYIFARGDWSAPVAHLPSVAGRAPVVARFSPLLYALLPPTSANNHAGTANTISTASPQQQREQPQQPQQQVQAQQHEGAPAADANGDAAACGSDAAAAGTAAAGAATPSDSPEKQWQEQGGGNSPSSRGGDGGAASPFLLPYRMVLAVATLNSVLIYDTQSLKPLVLLGGLHMAPITDLAWSADGCSLAVSSQDGYCSLAVFEPGELGTPLAPHELPSHVADVTQRVQAHKWAERCQQQAAAKLTAKQQHYQQLQQQQQQQQQQQSAPAGAQPPSQGPGPASTAAAPNTSSGGAAPSPAPTPGPRRVVPMQVQPQSGPSAAMQSGSGGTQGAAPSTAAPTAAPTAQAAAPTPRRVVPMQVQPLQQQQQQQQQQQIQPQPQQQQQQQQPARKRIVPMPVAAPTQPPQPHSQAPNSAPPAEPRCQQQQQQQEQGPPHCSIPAAASNQQAAGPQGQEPQHSAPAQHTASGAAPAPAAEPGPSASSGSAPAQPPPKPMSIAALAAQAGMAQAAKRGGEQMDKKEEEGDQGKRQRTD